MNSEFYGDNDDDNVLFDSLESVHSFFEADKFSGFVLTFNLKLSNKNNFKFEVYFKSNQMKKISVSDSRGQPIRFLASNGDTLTKSLLKIQVKNLHLDDDVNFKLIFFYIQIGTNYDSKEYLLRNYAAVMGEESNPTLLLQIDELDKALNLLIQWIDPESKSSRHLFSKFFIYFNFIETVIKTSKLNFNASNDEHLVSHTLFKPNNSSNNTSATPGIWTVNVVSYQILPNETVTNISTKFLVFPTKTDRKNINQTALINFVERFWLFEGFCIVDLNKEKTSFLNSYFDDNVLKDCKNHVDSYWSTYYDDPKSTINEDINESNIDFNQFLNMNYRLKN